MKNKILIIDIETTGFLPNGKLVEIGMVELDVTNGEKKVVFDSLCREINITNEHYEHSWIVQNGFISIDEILSSPLLEDIVSEVQMIIDSYTNGATAFNNRFDFGFLETYKFKIPVKLPCPMLLSTNICKLPNLNGYKSYKWPKVEEAYKFFFPESEYVEIHRGADDAFHEADIVYELIKRKVFTLNLKT
jgi:DNA polymerase-3 subunit epsilon